MDVAVGIEAAPAAGARGFPCWVGGAGLKVCMG